MPRCTVTQTCATGRESTEQVLGPIFIDHYVAVLEREKRRGSEGEILAELKAILFQVFVS